MSEWKSILLGDIITLQYGKGLPTTNRNIGEIPVYSSAGITGYHDVSLVDTAGIIIGRKGTVGSIYYARNSFWCIDTAFYILPNDEIYNLTFLYYMLRTVGLNTLNEDSAVPGLLTASLSGRAAVLDGFSLTLAGLSGILALGPLACRLKAFLNWSH